MNLTPFLLPPNQPADRFYRGGRGIADLRQISYQGGNIPEDWVASTTCLFGEDNLGLTRLASGDFLRDAIEADPLPWLGEDHVARWGHDTQLLTKLLDAGQRLPVHLHPDDDFAHRHLGRTHGKTEAWLVLKPGTVYLGFNREISPQELGDLVSRQDTKQLLGSVHAVDVAAGDGVLVPAGFPHAIGEGVLLVEVQQPEDLSILLEWEGFDLAEDAPRELGLGWDLALRAADMTEHSPESIEKLIIRGGAAGTALPGAANRFFRAHWVGEGPLEQGFSVLVVVEGEGTMVWSSGSLELPTGSVALIPHAATGVHLHGSLRAAWCRPPAPVVS